MSVNETLAFKLTASSYEDDVTRGLNDAMCDSNQCHGHEYDQSCPSGHTSTFCRGYSQRYNEGLDHQSGNGSFDEQTDHGSNRGTEDQGVGDSNSDFGINDGHSEQTGDRQSLTDKICNALDGGAGAALISLLHAAGIATGGTLNTSILAAQGYCAMAYNINRHYPDQHTMTDTYNRLSLYMNTKLLAYTFDLSIQKPSSM